MTAMIFLVTDFGLPYSGQMRAVLARSAPDLPVIDLFDDLPAWDIQAAAYLLAAFAPEMPLGSIFVCVVDPGVGGERLPLVLEADGRWFVGPDNGLLGIVARRAAEARSWSITWRPERLSNSFHGRDLFAPVAAFLARDDLPAPNWTEPHPGAEQLCTSWPDDLARIVYIDGFGNCMTGLRAAGLHEAASLLVKDTSLPRAHTFTEVPPGQAFWYENANGLAEIAVNQGRADRALGIKIGQPVQAVEGSAR